jgi:hypothetical protein
MGARREGNTAAITEPHDLEGYLGIMQFFVGFVPGSFCFLGFFIRSIFVWLGFPELFKNMNFSSLIFF